MTKKKVTEAEAAEALGRLIELHTATQRAQAAWLEHLKAHTEEILLGLDAQGEGQRTADAFEEVGRASGLFGPHRVGRKVLGTLRALQAGWLSRAQLTRRVKSSEDLQQLGWLCYEGAQSGEEFQRRLARLEEIGPTRLAKELGKRTKTVKAR